MDDKPLVYVMLGVTGSGRREVVADLIEAGVAQDSAAKPFVLLPADEPGNPVDDRLGTRATWRLEDGRIAAEVPADATHVFVVLDGRANPVDQIEALKPWIASTGLELARVICNVHCQLVAQHPPLLVWYDACIHFSDVVLLNHREGVPNKWMSDFRTRYESQFIPALFEWVKAGRVKNPALLLEPQARRISHYFDDEVEWVIEGDEIGEEDDLPAGDSEVVAAPAVDPYFERRAGGRRVKELPDITPFLSGAAPAESGDART